jgi:AcrR family transcriptional regulator
VQLVSVGGVSELSVSRLCALTGLTEAAFRQHYSTVAACMADSYDEITAGLLDGFSAAFAESPTWSDGLMLGMERLLERLSERPAEAQLCCVEVLRGDRDLLRHREVARRRMVQLLSDEHYRHDDSEHPRDIQHELLLGAASRLITAQVTAGQIEELPALAPDIADLVGVFEPVTA